MNDIYHNFWVKAPVALLEVPLPLADFKKEDGSYMNVVEYQATKGHTIDRVSTDGYFIKGFSFNYTGLKELEEKANQFGLEIGKNLFIFTITEVQKELEKEIWNNILGGING